MKKWQKRTGIGLGSIVLALILGIIVVYAASEASFRRAYDDVAISPMRAATGAASIERGRHLATAIGKCVDCHGGDLGGKVFIDAGPLGTVIASNLTTGRGGVISRYSDGQLERAIRHGIDADGRALAIMPSADYSVMSDTDVQALIAYLRTVPPVDRELPSTTIRTLGRALYVAGKLQLFPAEMMNHRAPRGAPVPAGVTVEYGQYLASIGGCRGCHGKDLAGAAEGEGPGMPPAANLTPAGELKSWSEAQFFRAMRTGVRPNGQAIRAPMPWALTGQSTDDELRALWMYIKSVPAAPTPTE
ncbi:MAG TPA: c-type cytochrome [Longimicrobium sp.]|nr:c-type cytochrome [Longimicrobium sp.]